MRVFLSSLGVGDHPERLVSVTGAGATVGVVVAAIDDRPAADRDLAWEIERDELAHLGLRPERIAVDSPSDVERIETLDALWVRGGNTFVLRAALARAGADTVITRRVLESSMAYGGYSAGAAVLSPDLALIAGIDDPTAAGPDPIMTGLGVLDRPVVPHVGMTAFDEGRLCTALHRQLLADGTPHHALRDGDVIATVDGQLQFFARRP